MANDIIERLRKLWFAQNPKLTWDDMEAITEEAAAEITRLRAENETLRRDVKTAVMGDSAELQDVKRENKKLRELLAEGHAALSWMLLEGMDVCIPETCPVEYKFVANAAGAIADAIGVSE